jgi:5-methylcytosine-specific restriction endonuclease McrA
MSSKRRPSAYRVLTQSLYGRQWERERKLFLSQPENALCVYCKQNNLLVEAIQVDHIIPHRGDQELFWDRSNWQPLCRSCGAEKSAREQMNYRTGKPVIVKGCTVTGLPLDPDHPWNR